MKVELMQNLLPKEPSSISTSHYSTTGSTNTDITHLLKENDTSSNCCGKFVSRIKLIIALIITIADYITDVWVIYHYFRRDSKYFGIILSFIIVFQGTAGLIYHVTTLNHASIKKSAIITKTSSNNVMIDYVHISESFTSNIAKYLYVFFIIGLASPILSIKCIYYGKTDRLYDETKYFETLLKAVPSNALQIYVLIINTSKYYKSFGNIFSIVISSVSIGYSTMIYFSRSYKNGNLIEFTPIIESLKLQLYLGYITTCDYICRVISILLLSRIYSYLSLFLFIFLFIFETFNIHKIYNKTFLKFALPFGWLGTFTVSVAYFASLANRFKNFKWFLFEISFRFFITLINCILILIYSNNHNTLLGNNKNKNDNNKIFDKNDLNIWIIVIFSLFILSGGIMYYLIKESKLWIQSNNLVSKPNSMECLDPTHIIKF